MEKPKTKTLDLSDLIYNTLSTAKVPEAVQTTLALPGHPVFVDIDPEQMRMALKNIVQNAVQAMKGAGALSVSAGATTSGEATISIADTGPGVSPEHVEKVFEPLFSTKTHGIGFGLSIAKMIVENHGGTIRAESAPDGGACFIIKLSRTSKYMEGQR